ncbi:MAG: hypothetical protein AB9919_06890 [Geobacteraceae bacterium]
MPEQVHPELCSAHHANNCEFANAAAEKAVKKTFAILGVDIEHPQQVAEFQESLRFGKKLFKLADHGVLVMVGALVVMAIAAFLAGIKSKLLGS